MSEDASAPQARAAFETAKDGPRLVLITAPDPETGLRLSRELVGARLAACGNLVPGLTSVYRFEGQVHEDPEVLLIVKTTAAHLPAIEAHLAQHHPHDVPECIALAPDRVEPKYLAWLRTETAGEDA
jgi:periplasmic divalent cation tolerance protein